MIRRGVHVPVFAALLGGCLQPDQPDDVLSLAAATPYRLMVPRLSAPFPAHGCDDEESGCPTLTVGSPEFVRLAEASNRIGTNVVGDVPARRSQHAVALAELLWSMSEERSLDRAIAGLERLLMVERRADLLSDLGAAYLLRADARGDASNLVLALDANERALQTDPETRSALFNRPLILHRLGLFPQALAAWEAYIAADPGSPWTEVAERLMRSSASAAEAARIVPAARVRQAFASGDTAAVARVARGYRQWARELAMDEVLPEWGRRIHSGAGADELLAVARAVGSSLVDQSVAQTVALIDSLVESGDAERVRLIGSSFQELGDGRAAYLGFQEGDALPALRRAHAGLARAGSPLAAWAQYWIGAALFGREQYEAAATVMNRVGPSADPVARPTLFGLVLWVRGVTALREGRYAEAADIYEGLVALMRRADETERTGVALGFLAEALEELGRPDEAWQYRLDGLKALSSVPQGRRLHAVLWESAGSAMERGLLPAAAVLQSAGVTASAAYGAPNLMSEALARQARIRLALADTVGALADLARARALAESVEDANNRERALADVNWIEGSALANSAPDSARMRFEVVIDYHEQRGNRLNLAAARVDRARFDLAAGDFESADEQLRSTLQVLEDASDALTRPDDKLAMARTARGLFDDLIRLHVWHRSDPVTGLSLGEEARQFALRYGAATAVSDPQARLGEIPEGTTIVSYALVGDSAVAWELSPRAMTFRQLALTARELREAAAGFKRAARSARLKSDLRDPAVRLFEALFPRGLPRGELVIVPDDALNGVPFAALIDPASERFVVETHAVTVVPSLSAYLATLTRERQVAGVRPRRALLVGRPAVAEGSHVLVGAAQEINALAEQYPESTRLLGGDASRTALLPALQDAAVLHFAGHAVFDLARPAASRLLLAPDTAHGRSDLVVGELDGLLDRSPRLVVLSACGSLSPSEAPGGGFWGLAQPFLTHGTSAVVGTLWDIPDQAVVPLVTQFHRSWLAGESGANALRTARLTLLQSDDPNLSAPSVWAAFQILGLVE